MMIMAVSKCPKCNEKGLYGNRCIKCNTKFCMGCGKDITGSKLENCSKCIEEYWGDKVDELFKGICLECGLPNDDIGHCTARTCKQCCADGKCLWEDKCSNDNNTFGKVKGIKPVRVEIDT